MSFFDSEFFDITTSGKLEGQLLDYDHPPMNGDIIPFADNYDYYPEHLGVAETSMDLEVLSKSPHPKSLERHFDCYIFSSRQ